MNIAFRSNKLRKEYSEARRLIQEHGPRCAKLIQQRLAELEAAPTLATMRDLPGARCHELHGDKQGILSVDLEHPYRLLFIPDHDPVPIREDAGGLDWDKITAIMILGKHDTHE